MREIVKELLINPAIYLPASIILIVYLFLALNITKQKRATLITEKILPVLIIILLVGCSIFPLNILDPRTLTGYDKTVFSSGLQLIIYIVFVLVFNSYFRGFLQNSALLIKDPFIIALLLLAILSPFWSETPLLSLRCGVVILCISAIAAHIAGRHSWEELSSILRRSFAYIQVISIFVAILIPSLARDYKGGLCGILFTSNSFGSLMALNAALWYLHLGDRRIPRFIGVGSILLSVSLVILSTSGTGLLTLVALMSLTLALKSFRRLDTRWAIVAVFFLILINIGLYFLITENLDKIFIALGKEPSLSGRTDFWPQLIDKIEKKPIVGYGYYGFWQAWRGVNNPAATIRGNGEFVPPNAHNGFLQLALELGLLGLGLFFASFLKTIVLAFQRFAQSRRVEAGIPLILLTYLVIVNISQPELFMPGDRWFYFVLIAVKLSFRTHHSHSKSLKGYEAFQLS
jgi:exopolysaccharide production protein ExoQ